MGISGFKYIHAISGVRELLIYKGQYGICRLRYNCIGQQALSLQYKSKTFTLKLLFTCHEKQH